MTEHSLHLFAVYVGGHVSGGNLEVHDMRFVIGKTIEDCYDSLRKQWWGIPGTLHLDGWKALDYVDGHKVTLRPVPPENGKFLYFVNLGGYSVDRFEEDHENLFIVAESEKEAEGKAKERARRFRSGVHQNTVVHKDGVFDVDGLLKLERVAGGESLHIHLEPCENTSDPNYFCAYIPIGKSAAA